METSLKGVSIVIGEHIGWSRNQVSQYFMLINKIATKILDYAKDHQAGRVAQNATCVTFNFTEWRKHFRNC
jgi:hypothetical protein